jgi:hypothetical protein
MTCCAVVRRYLAGVLDFTGELNRYAVGRATARDVGAVQRARDVVDALQGQFLHMDLRNGSLRWVWGGWARGVGQYCSQCISSWLCTTNL